MTQHILTSTLLSSSHAQQLEQLNDEEFWQHVTRLATETPISHLSLEHHLECRVEQRRCVVPLTSLREVVSPPHHIALFPLIPSWMCGLTAWRGETIAVIDLAAYLEQRRAQISNNRMMLIVQREDLTIGVLVTSVDSLITLNSEKQRSPEALNLVAPGVLIAVHEDALVLDMNILLTDIAQKIEKCR